MTFSHIAFKAVANSCRRRRVEREDEIAPVDSRSIVVSSDASAGDGAVSVDEHEVLDAEARELVVEDRHETFAFVRREEIGHVGVEHRETRTAVCDAVGAEEHAVHLDKSVPFFPGCGLPAPRAGVGA